ncbi:unnamed protein product [Rotaria socialis]|uniref:Mid1-interacting protein 1 n=1 Tax=Rotaria socialis TaxID=392032 RepID=A0A820BLG4_9BILA|nr:unnamed protein product [Rotaria socialis]CAF3430333.1 unnamed protein product [Rotaria socialis]CAF3489819.1 unnamed protein product [Rotaria socialis]CAF4194650.1 unnamed protein product [Rotaria socialis]CAF4295829.1 unnamed protein product [Rotaria socialis]
MTSKDSSSNLFSQQQINNKLTSQYSSGRMIQRRNQNVAYPRRQNIPATSSDLLNHSSSSTFVVPLLNGAMDEFFHVTKIMEDEVMLPSRLKDMPVDEVILGNSVQPNSWHELYSFVRDVRNQLTRSNPFVDSDNIAAKQQIKDPSDDEGILIASHDTTQNSSASSTASSDELEHSTTSSIASFDTIKDDLKHHFFGLIGSLDTLKTLASRVTDKYREDHV